METPQVYPARLVSRVLFTIFFVRCPVFGRKSIPADGTPYILALNHSSIIDPLLVCAFYPDRVHFLAKQELHEMPLLGWGLRRSGSIPVRRGAFDLKAIRSSLAYLKERRLNLAIFVEGTRSGDGEVGEAKHGCALLAIKSGVPVVPAFSAGSFEVLPRAGFIPRFSNRLAIHIGEPLRFESPTDRAGRVERSELEKATTRILESIELLNPDGAGPLAPKIPTHSRGGDR